MAEADHTLLFEEVTLGDAIMVRCNALRISAAAAGGEVLLSGTTAAAAGAPSGGLVSGARPHHCVVLHPRGRRELRNIAEPVDLFEASCEATRSTEGLPMDPVCRMAVDPEHAAGTLAYQGIEYRFCSLDCAGKFADAPERYAIALEAGSAARE